jgi:hypothetical protein
VNVSPLRNARKINSFEIGTTIAKGKEVQVVKQIKQLLLVAVFAGAAVFGVQGADKKKGSPDVDAQIRAAVAIFQDQKAAFLAQQKDQQKNNAKKVRDEVRAQVAASKSTTITPLRQDVRQSIEEAKRQAVEQSRKVAAEAADIARDVRR